MNRFNKNANTIILIKKVRLTNEFQLNKRTRRTLARYQETEKENTKERSLYYVYIPRRLMEIFPQNKSVTRL